MALSPATTEHVGHKRIFLEKEWAWVELRQALGDVDTGTSNHMTSNVSTFPNLDGTGAVKFGHNSLVDIHKWARSCSVKGGRSRCSTHVEHGVMAMHDR